MQSGSWSTPDEATSEVRGGSGMPTEPISTVGQSGFQVVFYFDFQLSFYHVHDCDQCTIILKLDFEPAQFFNTIGAEGQTEGSYESQLFPFFLSEPFFLF